MLKSSSSVPTNTSQTAPITTYVSSNYQALLWYLGILSNRSLRVLFIFSE